MKFLLIFLLFPLTAFCLPKDIALSLSKSRIHLMKEHFAKLAENCYQFDRDCGLENNTQVAIAKWLIWEQNENAAQIFFDKGRDKFFIDGAVRIAKTGNNWGSPIIFNEDLLVLDSGNQNYQPLDFYSLLSIFVHEFGHHQEAKLREVGLPIFKHEELDQLGAKISSYVRDRSRIVYIDNEVVPGLNNPIQVLQFDVEFDNGIRNIYSKIFISSHSENIEISKDVYGQITCPKVYRSGHIVFNGEPYYASFRQLGLPTYTSKENRIIFEQTVGEASMLCIDKFMNVFDVFSGYTEGVFHLEFAQKNGSYLLDKASSWFKAKTPPDKGR